MNVKPETLMSVSKGRIEEGITLEYSLVRVFVVGGVRNMQQSKANSPKKAIRQDKNVVLPCRLPSNFLNSQFHSKPSKQSSFQPDLDLFHTLSKYPHLTNPNNPPTIIMPHAIINALRSLQEGRVD